MRRDLDKDQFRSLRRLLALKRHEQPPPGFYHDFSSQVIARLRAGDCGEPENFLQRLLSEAPWLERWWGAFANRPTLAGAFGAGVCALLVSMVVYSEGGEPTSVNAVLASQGGPGMSVAAGMTSTDLLDRSALGSSTNPIAPASPSLFNQQLDLNIQPASFALPAN
jgi:hypothetical protein